jgi:hypothetical protein
LGSYLVATFDDVGGTGGTTRPGAANLLSGGISFTGGPGTWGLVSAATDDPNDPNRLFGDINPMYPSVFQAFSSPSILAFNHWGGNMGAYIDGATNLNAVGAVFIDVNSPSSAFIGPVVNRRVQAVSVPAGFGWDFADS